MAKIFFVMWVSGAGKTTVLNESGVLQDPAFKYVQSYTSRPLREGEVNGQKYHHISLEEFEAAIERGEFLEYAIVHQSHLYGTNFEAMTAPLADGISTIKEVEINWLIKIVEEGKIDGQYVSIFLDIPNDVMIERITSRGVLPDDDLDKRLESTILERSKAQELCHYIIDASRPLEEVVAEFQSIVEKEVSS